MKKFFLVSILLALFVFAPLFVFSYTEVTYPAIPGVEAPQDFLADAQREEVLPLFMTYFFHLLIAISIIVAVVIVVYGGVLHITSSGDAEKRKEARRWILSAMQGVLIVLFSYATLFALDSRFVLFETREPDDVDEIEDFREIEWTIKNVYYQIPFGMLIEDAILNEKAEEKLYAVLDATEDAEETAEDIYVASGELLEIIEECPEGEPCLGEEDMATIDRDPDISPDPQPDPDPDPWPDPEPDPEPEPEEEEEDRPWWQLNGEDEPSREDPDDEWWRIGSEEEEEEKEEAFYTDVFKEDTYREAPESGFVGEEGYLFAEGEEVRVTDEFGTYREGRNPPYDRHQGVDLVAGYGTTIHATHGGEVVFREYSGSRGHTVAVLHEDEEGNNYLMLYQHFSGYAIEEKGGEIEPGEPLGYEGKSGRASGSHLHYEIRRVNDDEAEAIRGGNVNLGAGEAVDPFDGFIDRDNLSHPGDDGTRASLFSASLFGLFERDVYAAPGGYVPTGNYFWDVGWCNHPHQYAPGNCDLWGALIPFSNCCREMREATTDDATVHREVPDEYRRFQGGICPDGWVRAGTFDCTGIENYVLPGSVCCQKTEEVEAEIDPEEAGEDPASCSWHAPHYKPEGSEISSMDRCPGDRPAPIMECYCGGEAGTEEELEEFEERCTEQGGVVKEECEEGETSVETGPDGKVCCVPDELMLECPDGMVRMSEETCPDEAVSELGCETIEGEEGEGSICCCPEEMIEETDCAMVFGEEWVEVDAGAGECADGFQDYPRCEFWEKEAGEIHVEMCCCTEEDIFQCPEETDSESDVPCEELDPPMQTIYEYTDPETGQVVYCCEEVEEEECPPCPDIAPAVQDKIAEIEGYMGELPPKLDALEATKDPILNDLYQLYKAVMLKSLGHRQVFGYNSLLLERRYYEREEVVIETDDDWEEWIDNIVYEVEVEGETIEENDPTTFYLRRPEGDEIIEDALELADEANERGIQDAGRDFGIETSLDNSKGFFQKVTERILEGLGVSKTLAMSDIERLEEYLEEEGIDPQDLSPEELNEIMVDLGIDPEDPDEPFDPREVEVKTPSDYLTCGMEIPVGETFELTWEHLVELLDTIDEYIEEGNVLLDRQAHMNSLAAGCDCPCEGAVEGEGGEVLECGECVLTCDLEAIRQAHEEVAETREKMRELADHIRLLTDGHFNTPTEDVCDDLNEDIRSEEEEGICEGGGEELITNHELITRKLNYSRFEFDECMTRPEHLEETLEGRRAGRMPFFGPLVEEQGLERYTKTEKEGVLVNTSEFNWFCCSDARLEE